MLGWMIVFLVVGIVIGSLVMSSCINDYVKAGVSAEARPHLPHCRYHVHTEGD